MSRPVPHPTRHLLMILAGFALWALAFVLLYGTQATGCKAGWHLVEIGPASLLRLVLALLFLLHLGAMLVLVRSLRRQVVPLAGPVRFLNRVALFSAWAAIASTLFTFVWLFWLSPCQ